MTRQKILFFGFVQGVGFRYTTYSLAKRFAVTGFVRNLRDGSVELVAEGAAAEIERFLDALRERLGEYIEREEILREPATGEFEGFRIH